MPRVLYRVLQSRYAKLRTLRQYLWNSEAASALLSGAGATLFLPEDVIPAPSFAAPAPATVSAFDAVDGGSLILDLVARRLLEIRERAGSGALAGFGVMLPVAD